eukprot:5181997-Alexandrium_andersonii.AAC.1
MQKEIQRTRQADKQRRRRAEAREAKIMARAAPPAPPSPGHGDRAGPRGQQLRANTPQAAEHFTGMPEKQL